MKVPTILFISLCSILPLSISARSPQLNQEYAKCEFVDSQNNSMPYRMLEPEQLEEGVTYPLVIFLHGSGERGDDNEKQLIHGASIFTNPVNLKKYPAFVIFPQCKERAWTGKVDESSFMPGASVPDESRSEEVIMELVDELMKQKPIDKNRIYILGISMGGIATYDLVCRHPDVFTAAVPICGAINPDRLPSAKNVKFMIFHGDADDEIPSICSREAYKKLSSEGATVDYIEFAGVGHDCWTSAFNYPSLLPWLFSQSKASYLGDTNETLTYMEE